MGADVSGGLVSTTTVMGVVGGDASLADPGSGGVSGDFTATSVFGEAGAGGVMAGTPFASSSGGTGAGGAVSAAASLSRRRCNDSRYDSP